MTILSEVEIQDCLKSLPDWHFVEDQLRKKFLFKNFAEALAFIVQVGIVSEKMDHHPEITNVYNQVGLAISTHSMKGITRKDIEWIQDIEKIR